MHSNQPKVSNIHKNKRKIFLQTSFLTSYEYIQMYISSGERILQGYFL